MKLFHAFPRPSHHGDRSGRAIRQVPIHEDRRRGFEILRLILNHGLLCTPEKFRFYPNYKTDNEAKQQFLLDNQPHNEIIQSRASFTLTQSLELTKEYELTQKNGSYYTTHTDLFGEFAIGLDPIEARELGIMPTVYYYRHDIKNSFTQITGLGAQIVERLDEIRTLFSILSYVEAKAHPEDGEIFPSAEQLKNRGIEVRYENSIWKELTRITQEEAALVFRLFETDRVPAWNLVDFVEIMLSLYQTTDSTIEDAPLSFFQQREWRLAFHMMDGLKWFGLGNHPFHRDPWAKQFESAREQIKDFILESSYRKEKDDDYLTWFFDNCWVLSQVGKLHFRNFVREIIVPEIFYKDTINLVESLHFVDPPIVTPLATRWRISSQNGIPYIIQTGS